MLAVQLDAGVQPDVVAPGVLTPGVLAKRDLALRSLRAARVRVQGLQRDISWASDQANRYRVEIHKKYSIALACLIFMMIGAPIGLFIRKGGLGVAATMAVAIFMFHWVSLANGEKLADRNLLAPWLGMWLADIVTGLVAIWLTFVVWRDLGSIPLPAWPWSRANRTSTPEASLPS